MKNAQVADAKPSARKDGAFLAGLRVNIKKVAEEARYLRHEERKIKSKQKIIMPEYWVWDPETKKFVDKDSDRGSKDFLKLQAMRKVSVRNYARALQLTYGFLREIPYKVIERETRSDLWTMKNIRNDVKKMVAYYGRHEFDEEVDKWFESDKL